MQSARPERSRAQLAHTGNLVAKPKKPEPSKPLWPDGSPYVDPVQLTLPFDV